MSFKLLGKLFESVLTTLITVAVLWLMVFTVIYVSADRLNEVQREKNRNESKNN